jgi:hypothetical protein
VTAHETPQRESKGVDSIPHCVVVIVRTKHIHINRLKEALMSRVLSFSSSSTDSRRNSELARSPQTQFIQAGDTESHHASKLMLTSPRHVDSRPGVLASVLRKLGNAEFMHALEGVSG